MTTQILIPQVLLSGIICSDHIGNKSQSINWKLPIQTYIDQTKRISKVLQNLDQESGTVFFWVLIEETIRQKEIFKIEQQLETEMQLYIEDNWIIEVFLIPGTNKNSIDELRFEIYPYIHKLFVRFPFERFAQVVGFGDERPFLALFLEGISQFGDRYVSLYIDQDGNFLTSTSTPSPNLESWGRQLRDLITDHDYQTAIKLLCDVNQTKETRALSLLLQMMIDRLNFAFTDAIEHLNEAINLLGEQPLLLETKEILMQLLSQNLKTRDMNRIIELYRQLDIYLDVNDIPSFLIRFYRAREAVLYYLLQHAQTLPQNVKIGKKSSIYQVVEQLEQMYDNWEIDGHYGAYFYLKSSNVARALEVRNNSFIGHGRTGIHSRQLWHSYFGTANTTIQKAKRRFLMDTNLMFRDFGIELDENIMDINRYILLTASKLFPKGT